MTWPWLKGRVGRAALGDLSWGGALGSQRDLAARCPAACALEMVGWFHRSPALGPGWGPAFAAGICPGVDWHIRLGKHPGMEAWGGAPVGLRSPRSSTQLGGQLPLLPRPHLSCLRYPTALSCFPADSGDPHPTLFSRSERAPSGRAGAPGFRWEKRSDVLRSRLFPSVQPHCRGLKQALTMSSSGYCNHLLSTALSASILTCSPRPWRGLVEPHLLVFAEGVALCPPDAGPCSVTSQEDLL